MLVSTKGQMIRIHVGDISEQGRNTQGVRLMNITGGNEKVVSFEYLAEAAATVEDGVGEPTSSGETVH
jgi:DNA gyrase/topoisomerase IV subunit A